jgi:hypothetical protein
MLHLPVGDADAFTSRAGIGSSDSNGRFFIVEGNVCSHEVVQLSVQASGYDQWTKANVDIYPDCVTLADVSLSPVDQDGDGLPDADEISRGTDWQDPTTDEDTFDDGKEVYYASDPLDKTDTPANGDVTESGAVNAGDVLVCTQAALGLCAPTSRQLVRCDMAPHDSQNGFPRPDGSVNGGDILRVRKAAARP